MAEAKRALGRSPLYEKPLTERVQVLFTEDHLPLLSELAARSNEKDYTKWLRRLALGEIPHPNFHPANANTGELPVKFLTSAPCGDWKEAYEEAGEYSLSEDMAHYLGAKDGDVIVQADGDSMTGARIYDGDLLLMRPLNGLRPRRNSVTLVQVHRKSGACEGMIKHWVSETQIEDGAGKAVALGKDVERIEAVATAIGLVARLF